MRIAFGTDESGPLTEFVKERLVTGGHEVRVIGENIVWTDVGRGVGEAVSSGRADRGIACCWTGTGVSIVANKVPGVRAALCTDADTAAGARKWNDANVLAMGLRLTSPHVAEEMIEAFLNTDPHPDETETIATIE